MRTEEECIWDKESLIEYVSSIIRNNFDNNVECRISYSKNYLVVE